MGIIRVETPQGIVRVEIEGNEPTQEELAAIDQQFSPQQKARSFDDLLEEAKRTTPTVQGQPQQANFDTKSGIQNFGLRAALSAAENNAEEESILAAQGFSQKDYTRDNRGRLALTPSGAAKVGVQTDKNTLIDE